MASSRVSTSAFHIELFDPLCRDVGATLMQDHLRRLALAIGFEGELGVDDFQKVVALGFGENFESRLASRLGEEPVAFARDRQYEIRGQLVAADIAVE